MGQYALSQPVRLSDSGPPPNANFHPDGKHQSLQGHGSPQNRVLGYTGDEYLDLDNGDKWNKMGPTDEPRRATFDEWEVDGGSESGSVTSTGTTEARTVGDRWAELRNLRDFGDLDDGVATLTAAFIEWDHVVIDGTVSIASNLTIAAGKVLIFRDGGALKPASGIKVTINGEVQAGRYEIFDYSASGTVVLGLFSRTDRIYPEWYGAKADNDTNNDAAFARIFDQTLTTSENQQEVYGDIGYYNFVTGFTGRSRMKLTGQGKTKTRYQCQPTATGTFIKLPDACDHVIFKDCQINCLTVESGVRTTAIGPSTPSFEISNIEFRSCSITSFNQYGVYLNNTQHLKVLDTEFTVSNIAAYGGGISSGPAICLRLTGFANAIEIGETTKTANSECFLWSTSSAALTIRDCRFEQNGAGATSIDAILGLQDFIIIEAGSNISVSNNYFEGNRAPTGGYGLITLRDTIGYDISNNRLNGLRAGGVTSVVDRFIFINNACYGGIVAGNTFVGTPTYYIYADTGYGVVFAPGNTFISNDGSTILTTYASIKAKVSVQVVGFSSQTDFNYMQAMVARLFTGTTAVVYPLTLVKERTGGAGGTNDGVGIKYQAMVSDGSVQNIGEQHWIYREGGAGSETSNIVFKALAAGAVVTPAELNGLGGFTIRGDVQTAVRSSAIDVTLTQADGTVYLTADAKTATLPNSTGLPVGQCFTVALIVGGAATGTVAFTNGTDRIQPSNAATYSLSADGKYVRLQLVAANTWLIIANN